MGEFVPSTFEVPREFRVSHYLIRPLRALDASIDCIAVNKSIALIHKTRGGSWPQRPITVAENTIELQEHQQLFEDRSAFAYTILDESASEPTTAGSLYVYKPHDPFDSSQANIIMPNEVDAVVNFWVTPDAYAEGFYGILYRFVHDEWLPTWPFRHPHINNAEVPTKARSVT